MPIDTINSYKSINTKSLATSTRESNNYYLEAGEGQEYIQEYDPNSQTIHLPTNKGSKDVLIEEFAPYYDPSKQKTVSQAAIKIYPNGMAEEIEKQTPNKFTTWFKEDGFIIGGGAKSGQGHPKALSAFKQQELFPEEYESYVENNIRDTKFLNLFLQGDTLAFIEKADTEDPITLIKSIYFSDGSSLYKGRNQQAQSTAIKMPAKFNKKSADKITNFNPSTDTLEINTDSFGIDSSATFAAGKNMKEVKKKLAKQDFDFLYDEKKGGLYFNENGSDKGFGDGGIIAILKGAPDLTSGNLEFI